MISYKNLIVFTLIFLFIGTKAIPAQTLSQEVLTYEKFGDLLIKTTGIKLPEDTELLSDEEYYEVIANIFAERGINDFIEHAPSDVVSRSGMANVIYSLSGAVEELEPDGKLDYLIENGYMPKGYLNSIVTFVEGDVLILKKGTKEWQSTKPGESLSDGDSVKTLEGSRAKLQFSSSGKIILKEESSIDVRSVDSNGPEEGGSTELYLSRGELKASVERLGTASTFEIKTPTAVCGIRGTIFYLKLDEKRGIFLFVESGNVNLASLLSNLFQSVGENKSSSADNQGNVTDPQDVPPEERWRWILGYEGAYNAIPILLPEGIDILNNPALAALIAEPFSGSGAGAAGGNTATPDITTEGPVTPI